MKKVQHDQKTYFPKFEVPVEKRGIANRREIVMNACTSPVIQSLI